MVRNLTALQPWGLTVLRAALGIVFLAHGSQKLFTYGIDGVTAGMASVGIPFPAVSAVLVTGVEFLGGLALLLGLFTRAAAIPLAITMLVATLQVHAKGGFFLPNGYEFTLTLLAASIALALTGPGALALDNRIFRERTAGNPKQVAAAA
ncbi:MAG: DoxX family protein [Candidatus Korobacteraceae bacterium]